MTLRYLSIWIAFSALLAACTEQERILKGERIDIQVPLSLTVDRVSGPEIQDVRYANLLEQPNVALPINLPPMISNLDWPQLNGNTEHRTQHPVFSSEPQQIWSSRIGAGNTITQRITASPVAAQGLIFTMDSQSQVVASDADGERIWSVSLVPPFETKNETSGGGLAYREGVLYATTGFGRLHALRASNGESIWEQQFDGPSSYAPTVTDELVFVVNQTGQSWAIERGNGRLRRNWDSIDEPTSIPLGVTPAVRGDTAIIPFPSGEIQAANVNDGTVLWSVTVGGARDTSARSSMRSISSAPVIDGQIVYVGNQAGRMAAIDFATGEIIWTALEGSYSPVWPSGGSVFVVTDNSELVRLSAENGERIWGVQLPSTRSAGVFGERDAIYANFGPVLAGGRLIVGSGDNKIRFFDPISGRLVSELRTSAGAAATPIVVQGVLYVVDDNGSLSAYR